MKIKALVAVRSGSVRVDNKNIRPFSDSSILEIKLRQLLRIKTLDGIIVNSNDDTMLKIAENLGCETIKRDDFYASNTVSMSDVYKNMAEHCDCDTIVYANVTNPLVKDISIHKAIEQFKGLGDKNDSLNSATILKEFIFKDNLPVNYDLRHQPRSQDLPDYYVLNFAINILSRESMIECKNVIGYKPLLFELPRIEATDIDEIIDFEFAEFVYKRGVW